MADSLGYFKIENVKPGKCKLSFSFMGCFTRDTTVVIEDKSIDSITMILPLWYDKERFRPIMAEDEIAKGHPCLFACVTEENFDNFVSDKFWGNYNPGYAISTKELLEARRQYLSAPPPILARYNQETFKHLDFTFGKKWREEAPTGIFGLKDWMDADP